VRTPLLLVVLGAVLYAVGFALGSNNVDPASAIIATPGAALVLVGLVWAVVVTVRSRRQTSR
jgi:hypothetical protein